MAGSCVMEKEWEKEFDTPELMYCELLKLRSEIVKERSKNAFIEVTGKSLADIHADGVFEVLRKMKKDGVAIDEKSIEDYVTNIKT